MSKANQISEPWADKDPLVIENMMHDARISGSSVAESVAYAIELAIEDCIGRNRDASEQEIYESVQATADEIIKWAEKFKAAIAKAEGEG